MTNVSDFAAGYRPAVVTFLDVLGFRELVHRSSAEEIRATLRSLRSFSNPGSDDYDDEMEETRYIAFSDSIVRVRFYDTPYRVGALWHEILDLLHAQGELAGRDVLVRGGVSVGEVFIDGDMVFGPGFVRAYDLESQFANFPRIVIGPEAFRALRTDRRLIAEDHDLAEELGHLRSLLKRGEDGLWFIDYLFAFRAEMDDPERLPEFVERHRDLIVRNANAASPASRVLQKYLWLARYLNNVVSRARLPDLMIRQADIQALERLN